MLELKVNNDKFKSENTSLKLHIESIQMQVSRQNQNTEELMKYTIRNCLVITGVSEKQNENTYQLVKELIKSIMEIELADETSTEHIAPGTPQMVNPELLWWNLPDIIRETKSWGTQKCLKAPKLT